LGIEVVVFTPATQQTPDGASAISAGHQSIYPPIHQSKLLVHLWLNIRLRPKAALSLSGSSTGPFPPFALSLLDQ
jgi:hypothetical protein